MSAIIASLFSRPICLFRCYALAGWCLLLMSSCASAATVLGQEEEALPMLYRHTRVASFQAFL